MCLDLLKNLYIVNLCYFFCAVSSIVGLALAETDSGRFMLKPLMMINLVTILFLTFVKCVEEGDVDDMEDNPCSV